MSWLPEDKQTDAVRSNSRALGCAPTIDWCHERPSGGLFWSFFWRETTLDYQLWDVNLSHHHLQTISDHCVCRSGRLLPELSIISQQIFLSFHTRSGLSKQTVRWNGGRRSDLTHKKSWWYMRSFLFWLLNEFQVVGYSRWAATCTLLQYCTYR